MPRFKRIKILDQVQDRLGTAEGLGKKPGTGRLRDRPRFKWILRVWESEVRKSGVLSGQAKRSLKGAPNLERETLNLKPAEGLICRDSSRWAEREGRRKERGV